MSVSGRRIPPSGSALTVAGNLTYTSPLVNLTSGKPTWLVNNGAQIAFGYHGTQTYQHFIFTRHGATLGENSMDFYLSDGTESNAVTSGSNLVMTLNGRNVGIGTTSPYAKLSVVGPVVAEYFHATSSSATSTFAGGLSAAGSSGLTVFQDGRVGIGGAPINYAGTYTASVGSAAGVGTLYVGGEITLGGNLDKITNSGSPGYFDFKSGSGGFSFNDGSATFLKILSSGNLGIGTTSPYAKLSVVGPVVAEYFHATSTSASTFNGGLLSFASSTIGAGGQATGLTISGGATTTGRAYFAGNVDIGEVFPGTNSWGSGPKLMMYSSGGGSFAPTLELSGTNTDNGEAVGRLAFTQGVHGTSLAASVYGYREIDNGRVGLRFQTNGTDSMTITANSRNVGIGTTSPFAKLSVAGNIFANENITGSNITATGTLSVSGLTTLANASTTLLSTNYASSTLYYGAGLTTCASENMLTWTDGRFGCESDTSGGGASFGQSWEFFNSAAYLAPTTTVTVVAPSILGVGTTSPWGRLSVGHHNLSLTTPSFVIASSSTGVATSTQFIVVNGNVGIGTTSPYAKLSVEGNIAGTSSSAVISTSNSPNLWFSNYDLKGANRLDLTTSASVSILRAASATLSMCSTSRGTRRHIISSTLIMESAPECSGPSTAAPIRQ